MPPRFSLWLLPPSEATDVDSKLSDLISTKIPSLFPSGTKLPRFAPHITLATGIDASLLDSKDVEGWPAWLASLDLQPITDGSKIQIAFTGIGVGNTFTKKCYVRVQRTAEFELLAKQLQVQIFGSSEDDAVDWMQNQWDPHLSLLYWDGQVSASQVEEVTTVVVDAGFNILRNVGEECQVWTGGRIQLVDTSKPVEQWTVLAQRDL